MAISQQFLYNGMTIIEQFLCSIRIGQEGDLVKVENFIDSLASDIGRLKRGDIINPVPLKDMQFYSIIHALNVTIYAILFAVRLKMKSQDLINIGMGALLHDVGKINTPEHLLWKQTATNEYEDVAISEHPVLGAHWISTHYSVPDSVTAVIREHHEHYDGNGYPKGIAGRSSSNSVSIVSICNHYDYLITHLPGKPELDKRQAMFELVQLSEKKFHPKFLRAFVDYVGPFLMKEPLYRETALVLLDSKEIAAVMKTQRFGDIEPEILVLTNAQGKKLDRPISINLKKDNTRKIVKLLKVG